MRLNVPAFLKVLNDKTAGGAMGREPPVAERAHRGDGAGEIPDF